MKECIGKQIKTFSFLKDRHGREQEPEREPREMFADWAYRQHPVVDPEAFENYWHLSKPGWSAS